MRPHLDTANQMIMLSSVPRRPTTKIHLACHGHGRPSWCS